jgi:hypothetical protein
LESSFYIVQSFFDVLPEIQEDVVYFGVVLLVEDTEGVNGLELFHPIRGFKLS